MSQGSLLDIETLLMVRLSFLQWKAESRWWFSCSVVSDFAAPWTAALQPSLSFTISWSLLKPMSIESVMLSNHFILFYLLLLLPPFFPSIRIFSSESALPTRWTKYWSFSFNIRPSNEYSGLISFRMVWVDLLAVQGTLKSLLQQHSSKASIFQRSVFFIVQLSHPYMTTGKIIALTRWTFVESESEVTQSCPTLCDPVECCTPGFPVHHQLPELAQNHVH